MMKYLHGATSANTGQSVHILTFHISLHPQHHFLIPFLMIAGSAFEPGSTNIQNN